MLESWFLATHKAFKQKTKISEILNQEGDFRALQYFL